VQRQRRESIRTDRVPDRRVERGILIHSRTDVVGNAVIAPDLIEQLGEGAWSEAMNGGDGTLPTRSADGIVAAR
jgi:hypothetical protein